MKSLVRKLIPARYHLCLSFYVHKFKGMIEPEIDILPELPRTRQMAIDVGANRGMYTYALSRIFDKVEAFEPAPENFSHLIKCRPDNVVVHNIGLSDMSGVLELNIPNDTYGESPSFIDFGCTCIKKTVTVKTLDEYDFRGVSLIKIDVEGYESSVLRGAEATISREKPVLLVEIEQRHLERPITEVFDMICGYGYRGYYLRHGKLLDISNFSYETDQKPYLNNLKSPSYINNFIFKPK